MELINLKLHDGRIVTVNVEHIAYFLTLNPDGPNMVTRILMSGCPEPIDVLESQDTLRKMLQGDLQ